jgi:hypothetical protein
MAAFHPRSESKRHETAARLLDYEILKFGKSLREYRSTEPRPRLDGPDLFLKTVETISRNADLEPEIEDSEVATPKDETPQQPRPPVDRLRDVGDNREPNPET